MKRYMLDKDDIQEMLDMQNLIIFWKDLSGYYIGCNKHYLNLLGLSNKEEFIGKTDFDLFTNEDADRFKQHDAYVLKSGEFVGEECAIINGIPEYYSIVKTRLTNANGDVVGIYGMATCITDIKNKMEMEKRIAILDEEAKTAQIVDLVPAFIYWKHKNEHYISCNQYQKDAWGVDITGHTEYDVFPKEDADRIHAIDQYVLENGSYSGEEIARDPASGKTKYYFSSKRQLLNSNGDVLGIIGVSMDITPQKEKEAERLETENQAHMIRAHEDEKFRKVVRQLSHDINAPISSINNIVSRLSHTIPENDRITLRNASERISGISQRLLSRYDKQEDEDENNEVFLVSLALTQIVNERREDHRNAGVIIELDIDPDDEKAKFSCIKHNCGVFKRMISNLVKNAVEALNGKANGKVAINYGTAGKNIAIIIQDNGPGMPEHIQKMFKEGIEVTEGKENGHGIGLTQVKDAVTTGGGKFEVYGNESGTRIIIWFPIVSTPGWIEHEIKLTKDDTVVILDDDESIHGSWDSSLAESLAENPTLQVKHFSNGHEAVKYINSLTPEQKQDVFLLTDFELLDQDIDGLEVVKQTQILRAILVTSHSGQKDTQNKVIESGIKMLPKELAADAKITVDKKIPARSNVVDMVWVEDQKFLVDSIVEKYYSHLKVDVYYNPIKFMENVHQYPLDTRIILDTYYDAEDGTPYLITGYQLARQLHDLGFTKLIIYVGEAPQNPPPEYLQVVSKGELHADENMDKI